MLPLQGVSVVVTREASQALGAVGQLQDLGAEVVSFPVLAFERPDDPAPLERCLATLEGVDWLLFTSANGVEAFFQALGSATSEGVRIGAIGPATAEALGRWNARVDCMPSEYVAEAFLKALQEFPLQGQRVVLARAQEAREVLPEGLRALGARVEVVPVYKTVLPAVDAALLEQARRAQWVLFTSSSCARNYTRLAGVVPSQRALAISAVTARTATEAGWSNVTLSPENTVEGMIRRLVQR